MFQTLKKTIRHTLESNDLEAIASLAVKDRKVLSQLVRFAYEKETLVGWRAIKAVGLAARAMVKTDREFLRDTCRKLLWSLSDESGGIGWSAPEMLGEIVSADPVYFGDIIPLIAEVYDIEEDVFRPGVVYAMGRIAAAAPRSVVQYQKIIISSLVDQNPLTRAYGLGVVAELWKTGTAASCWSSEYCERIRSAVVALREDKAEVWIYEEKEFHSIMVVEHAESVIEYIT